MPDVALPHLARTAPRDDIREIEALLVQLEEQAQPRRAGSPGEAMMAAFVNGRLRRAGMGVATYPLDVTVRTGGSYIIVSLLGLLLLTMSLWLPILSLLVALILFGWLIVDVFGAPIPPIGRRSASQTIVGVRAIEGAAGLNPRAPRWRVVLLAPLDSTLAWGGVRLLAGSGRVGQSWRIGTVLLLVVATGVALLFPMAWWLVALPSALGWLLLLLAALIQPLLQPAKGEIEALAALLSVAQREQRLRSVELWAVAVGATQVDPRGLAGLLHRLPFEPEATLFVSVERLAGEQLVLVTHDTSMVLTADAEVLVESSEHLAHSRLGWPPQRSPLTWMLQRYGYRTLSIMAHPATDVRTGLYEGRRASLLVDRVSRLASGIIAQLEQGNDFNP
jgi:hypothetical protein